MSFRVLQICATALLCLSSLTAWSMTGAETADALNLRFNDTPERCAANQPDYACSGVLALPLAPTHAKDFWKPDAAASQRGSERFLYVRSDRHAATALDSTGYILMNSFEAVANDKSFEVGSRSEPNVVEMQNWDTGSPNEIPVQAIYYRLGAPGALARGHRHQLAWYQATGEWLPLVRYLPEDAVTPFGFAQHEQLSEGYAVAARINARFADTSPTCKDGTSRYHCNGVWVRTTDVGNFRAWNVSPSSIRGNGVSFSYFAADMSIKNTFKRQGFIIWPSALYARQPLTLRCMYPYDNHTTDSADMCKFKGVCASKGIRTAKQWLDQSRNTPHNSCAFGTDANSFTALSEIRNANVNDIWGYNELIMAPWPSNVPADLPLEAFIYSVNALAPDAGISGVQRFQREYQGDTKTGHLPILRFDPAAPGGQLVTYRPEDQSRE